MGRPQPATHFLNNVVVRKLAGAQADPDAKHRGQLEIQPRVQPLDQTRARPQRCPEPAEGSGRTEGI